jgi:uncharacterized protein (TIGR02646 family)
MKHLVKTQLGSNVLERQQKIAIPKSKEEAEQRWQDFGKKTVVRNKILAQQFYLCAYTEFQIAEFCSISGSKEGCHIEHIKPKSQFPDETFSYHNLIISILSADDLRHFKAGKFDDAMYFAGHHKDASYSECPS